MKNIHIIPTDKPSRLFKASGELKLTRKFDFYNGAIYQNIYITSDEEIKEGDYGVIGEVIMTYSQMYKMWNATQGKKIILTTDQDLINDGVQKIDDDFLEWFVKNPSCEEIEVKKEMYMPFDGKVPFELSLDQSLNTCTHYKIITKDYLQGFIDLHNNELEHWDAVEFLEWLKLNDFKIVKK